MKSRNSIITKQIKENEAIPKIINSQIGFSLSWKPLLFKPFSELG